jgi:carboxyl-terminal processing protease
LVEDKTTSSGYGIYVMLGETTNVLGVSDYGTINGITPTYEVKDDVIPYAPLGSFSETLLKKTLEVMGESTNAMARKKTGSKMVRYSPYTFKESTEYPLAKMIIELEQKQ